MASSSSEIQTTKDVYLWCVAVIYLFAFSSLFVQIPGLYGENGILPAKLVLEKEAESFLDLLTNQPTLLRLLPKVGLDLDTGMDFLCIGGALLAFVAMVSRDQRNCVVFSVLWMFYLSLFQIGQTFLWFQWDILLLEAGFLTIIIAPLNCFGYFDVVGHLPHDAITFWLVKWLLFRRTFASGVSKLASENSTWWSLTEMNHHYETQHLPTALAWYFHQWLPDWFQRLSAVTVITIQIPISLFFFSPYSNQRRFAFYCQCLLSTVMMLSGNYGFYTLLTLTLSLSLVDDRWLQSWTKNHTGDHKKVVRPESEMESLPLKWIFCFVTYGALIFSVRRLFSLEFKLSPLRIDSSTAFTHEDLDSCLHWMTPVSIFIAASSLFYQIKTAILRCQPEKKNWAKVSTRLAGCVVFGLLALVIFCVSLVPHTSVNKNTQSQLPDQLKEWHSLVSKNYQLTSPYMFYSRSTDVEVEGRMEVIIEGSNVYDGDWKEYAFRFKPGNTSSELPIVSPHQPRLDWQMWFVARGDYESNHWLLNLVYRLLTNQKEVLELMGDNPFPDSPPKYVRCTLYQYHFASGVKQDDKYSAVNWWVREPLGEYMPILSLDEPSMMEYIKDSQLVVDDEVKRPGDFNPLRSSLERIRSLFGQGNGSCICLVLVIAGFLLTLLDPSINLLAASGAEGPEVEPLVNGHHHGQPLRHRNQQQNDVKSN